MCRPGLVETAHQYEACHLILEGVLSGPPRGGKGGKNKKGEGRKWNPFRKKSLVGVNIDYCTRLYGTLIIIIVDPLIIMYSCRVIKND